MASPSLSVVMSVFNGQAFLSEAIESILGQTFGEFEFVVIDDGSTDKTAEILAQYASRDARLRVLRHDNKGRPESLNVGIEVAKGKYIARMDADDVAMPCRLAEQIDFMERHPEVCLLGGAIELINSAGHVVKTSQPPLEDAEIRSTMLRYNPMFHPTVVMRKELALAAGGYRKALLDADDYDLWLRMSERSRLANLGATMVKYRVHSGQVSIRNLQHQTQCVLAARAAASVRKRGMADPLSNVEEITPQLLEKLGVTAAETQEALLGAYAYWAEILELIDPEEALRVIEGLLRLPGAKNFPRSTLANAWLKAAGIHYRQGRPAKALAAAGRAVLVRPIVVGRPVKRIITRIAAGHTFSNVIDLYWRVHPGSRPLVFDVGANTGAKTEQYLRKGARVVSFEPQSTCVETLRKRFRGNSRVVVVPTALGAHIGEAEMSICTQENTISTLTDAWKTGRFKDKIWDRTEVVPVTTLDAAIDRYGMPFYCKIDVEGFEHSVLSGLTRQIPVLSFEFSAESVDQTQACLDLLSRLGYAAFNACLGETGVYALRGAVSSAELMNYLKGLNDPLAWGDVYAAVGPRMPDSRLLPRERLTAPS
jgi:FkbM family methyltransferase